MNNYTVDNGTIIANQNTAFTNTGFKNCIIYGTNDNELELDIDTGTATSDFRFINCVLKTDINTPTTDTAHFTAINTSAPDFKDTDANDYNLLEIAVSNTYLGYNTEDLTGDGIVESADYVLIQNNSFYNLIIIRP